MESFIILYIGLVCFLILFHLFAGIQTKFRSVWKRKEKYFYKMIVGEELQRLNRKKGVSTHHLSLLKRQLFHVNHLLLFEDVLVEFQKKNSGLVASYCNQISEIFPELANLYREKSSMHKAYFTHFLSIFPEVMQQDDNCIEYAMMHFVYDTSVYCRENAMLFFYHKGIVSQIINSLKKISTRNLYYSPKLLADDLGEFQGDQNLLVQSLLTEFDSFHDLIQLGIMNYFRFQKVDCIEVIYQKFKQGKYHKEVILSMIRYFATFRYKYVKDDLLKIMKDTDESRYEYRLVSAFALSRYDEKKVRSVLIDSLCDRNWYVRKNAALSLSKMDLTQEDFDHVKALHDPYGQEMFYYMWQDAKNRKEENL